MLQTCRLPTKQRPSRWQCGKGRCTSSVTSYHAARTRTPSIRTGAMQPCGRRKASDITMPPVFRWIEVPDGACRVPVRNNGSAAPPAVSSLEVSLYGSLYADVRNPDDVIRTAGPRTTVEMFEELQALHVNMDAINDNGQGCLHKAAQRGNKEICVWLLEVAKVSWKRALVHK